MFYDCDQTQRGLRFEKSAKIYESIKHALPSEGMLLTTQTYQTYLDTLHLYICSYLAIFLRRRPSLENTTSQSLVMFPSSKSE